MAILAVLLGVLIFAFDMLATSTSVQALHIRRFAVYAPSVASGLLPVFLGLLTAALVLSLAPRREPAPAA